MLWERLTLNASMLSETFLTTGRRVKEGIYVTITLLLDVPIARIQMKARKRAVCVLEVAIRINRRLSFTRSLVNQIGGLRGYCFSRVIPAEIVVWQRVIRQEAFIVEIDVKVGETRLLGRDSIEPGDIGAVWEYGVFSGVGV